MALAGPSVKADDALRGDCLQQILSRRVNLRDHSGVCFPAGSRGVAPKADVVQTLTKLPSSLELRTVVYPLSPK